MTKSDVYFKRENCNKKLWISFSNICQILCSNRLLCSLDKFQQNSDLTLRVVSCWVNICNWCHPVLFLEIVTSYANKEFDCKSKSGALLSTLSRLLAGLLAYHVTSLNLILIWYYHRDEDHMLGFCNAIHRPSRNVRFITSAANEYGRKYANFLLFWISSFSS